MFLKKRPINKKTSKVPVLYGRTRTFLDWLLVSGKTAAVLGLVWISYHVFVGSKTFSLEKVKIEGSFHSISEKNLLQLAKIPYGENLFRVSLFPLIRNLKKNPWINEVSVRRSFPDTLIIRVTEHEPVMVLKVQSGKETKSYLVGSTGEVFMKAPEKGTEGLAVIHGFEEAALRKYPLYYKSQFQKVFEFINEFPNQLQDDRVQLVGVSYEVPGDVTARFSVAGSDFLHSVYFGSENFKEKWQKFLLFLPQLAQYREVDLHVNGKIFARASTTTP